MIICDIDSTLANIDHRLHFLKEVTEEGKAKKNWGKFEDPEEMAKDTVNKWCREILSSFSFSQRIVFITGRSVNKYQETWDWLEKNVFPYLAVNHESRIPLLLMRPPHDSRSDYEVKKEAYQNYADCSDRFKYDQVLFVLEDRKQVVDMWRNDFNFTVLQCAEGLY